VIYKRWRELFETENSENQWDGKDRASNDAIFDVWTESSRVSGAKQTTEHEEHYTLNLFVLFH